MLQPARPAPGRPDVDDVHARRKIVGGKAAALPFQIGGSEKSGTGLFEKRGGNARGVAGAEAEIEKRDERQEDDERQEQPGAGGEPPRERCVDDVGLAHAALPSDGAAPSASSSVELSLLCAQDRATTQATMPSEDDRRREVGGEDVAEVGHAGQSRRPRL